MSRLEELIQALCPDGVEYIPLWSVTIWDKKFNAVDRKKQPKVINYPYLLAAELFALQVEPGDVFLLSTGEQTGWTTEELAGENMRVGEVVTMPWGKSRAVTDCIKYYKGKFVTADNRIMTSADTSILSNKFLYYWFMSVGKEVDTFYRGSGIKHPDMAKVLELKMPLPPLPVQEEIVRILDNFTELTTELTTELEARKKQYEYYRDQLLESPRGEVIETTMGNVLTFLNGRAYKQEELLGAGKYPVLRVGNFYTNSSWYYSDLELEESKYCENGDLLYSWAATLGPKIWDGGKCIFHYHIWKILFDEEVIDKQYLYYYLQYDLSQIAKSTTKSTMIHVSMGSMKGRPIRLPHISEQKRIAQLIRRFDVLSSDMKMGLPAEIEARKKQYEFYRDKLLSFKEAGK